MSGTIHEAAFEQGFECPRSTTVDRVVSLPHFKKTSILTRGRGWPRPAINTAYVNGTQLETWRTCKADEQTINYYCDRTKYVMLTSAAVGVGVICNTPTNDMTKFSLMCQMNQTNVDNHRQETRAHMAMWTECKQSPACWDMKLLARQQKINLQSTID